MYSSIDEVLRFLEAKDPDAAAVARQRYSCLTPWQHAPSAFGSAALSGNYKVCEEEVARMLQDMLKKSVQFGTPDEARFLDAVQNARLIANAERYYRVMYYGSRESWNLGDRHISTRCVWPSTLTGRMPKRSFGSTIRISAMPPPPRWGQGARKTSGGSAARHLTARPA
jgi:erythromycin esterase-like protein